MLPLNFCFLKKFEGHASGSTTLKIKGIYHFLPSPQNNSHFQTAAISGSQRDMPGSSRDRSGEGREWTVSSGDPHAHVPSSATPDSAGPWGESTKEANMLWSAAQARCSRGRLEGLSLGVAPAAGDLLAPAAR